MNSKILLYIIFVLSGATALIYEILWARQLEFILGTTVHSISAILFVFFTGLALGGYLSGRFIDLRKINLLRSYGWLELGIGIYALATPFFFSLISTLQTSLLSPDASLLWLILVRYLLVFAALIIPATFMGSTLPILTKFLTSNTKIFASRFGFLYSINTLGGVLGALLVGFILIVQFGLLATLIIAASTNIIIALILFSLSSKVEMIEKKNPDRYFNPDENLKTGVILLSFFLAGLGAIAVEVLWTRMLVTVIGSSVYAFSIVLIMFLLGIVLGSAVSSRSVGHLKNPLMRLVWIEALISVFIFLSALFFTALPSFFLNIFEISSNFGSLIFLEFFLVAFLIFPATFLMGMAFPVVARLHISVFTLVGQSAGKVYSVNTLGGVFGPLFASFLLIPFLGVQRSVFLISLLFIAISLLLFFSHHSLWIQKGKQLFLGGLTLVLLILSFTINPWDYRVLDSAPYLSLRTSIALEVSAEETELLFYKEGLSANVSVTKSIDGDGREVRSLRINGKTDASTGGDMSTQILLGALPYLLHPQPNDALVVGLGSGISLGSLVQYPVSSVDVVEIEPAVIEASRYFNEENYGALNDGRVKVFTDDARHFLQVQNRLYDVISAEPSNPWISGVSNLFTREQFQLYSDHLKPGGIVVQWIHTHGIGGEDLKTVLATFHEVFPHVLVWQNGDFQDLFLVGSEEQIEVDFQQFSEHFRKEAIREDLARGFLDDPFTVLSYFVFDDSGLENLIKDAALHTDNHPVLEFSAPYALNNAEAGPDNVKFLVTELQSARSIFNNMTELDIQKLNRYMEGLRLYINAITPTREARPVDTLIDLYERSLTINPENESRKSDLGNLFYIKGQALLHRGDVIGARSAFESVLVWAPAHQDASEALSDMLFIQGGAPTGDLLEIQ